MSSKAMSLKAKIRNYVKSNNIAAQVVLQNYMFERFFARLSESDYNEVIFEIVSIETIHKVDRYGGFCVRLHAVYDMMVTPLSIDISAGDVITPSAVRYEFGGIFDEEARIRLWGYNIETVMAEKAETILRRGVFNTRSRDYYDIYIFGITQKYDKHLFKKALAANAEHGGSTENIADTAKERWNQISLRENSIGT